jgi:hypothetical protein
VTAQVPQVSRQWFECVDVTPWLDSRARNQCVKADVRPDVIHDITRFEMSGEEALVIQLPVPQPESPRAGIGHPTFAPSWTTYNADDRARRK